MLKWVNVCKPYLRGSIVVSTMSRTLNRTSSDISDDCWGQWGPGELKIEQQGKEPQQPEPIVKLERHEDAQPRHWGDWHSSVPSVNSTGAASGDTGGTERQEENAWDRWAEDSWSGPWVDHDCDAGSYGPGSSGSGSWHSGAWHEKKSSEWKQGETVSDTGGIGNENHALMKRVEDELVHELRATHGDVDEVDKVALAIGKMGKRHANQAEAMKEGLALLEKNALPKNHRSLQAARRDPGFKEDRDGKANNQFIKEFFEKTLDSLVIQYTHVESYDEEEGIKAEFLSFDAIVEKEGGRHNEANIEAARKRCQKCIQEGKQYAKYDKWSDRTNFAFIVEGFSALRKNSYKKSSSGGAAAIADAPPVGVPGGAPPGKAPAPPPASRLPRSRTSLEKNISASQAAKSAYTAATKAADDLLEQMQSDASYNKEKISYEDDLAKSVAALRKAKDSDPFYKKFVGMEIGDIRREYPTTDVLSAHCVKMNAALFAPVAATEKMVKTIRSVIRARLSVLCADAPVAKKTKTKPAK